MLAGPLKIRVNGFQFPPSRDQIKTLTTYPFTVICYYLILSIALPKDDNNLVMLLVILNGILSIFLFVAWVTVEYLDPEQKQNRTGIPILCYSTPEKSARFCGACRKTVSGLDHHCTWLNTCVGRRNYFSFICLVFIGAAQSTLHSTIGFISLIHWISNEETANMFVVNYSTVTASFKRFQGVIKRHSNTRINSPGF
jgi:palmitoyltransferase ZDHHC1/11